MLKKMAPAARNANFLLGPPIGECALRAPGAPDGSLTRAEPTEGQPSLDSSTRQTTLLRVYTGA